VFASLGRVHQVSFVVYRDGLLRCRRSEILPATVVFNSRNVQLRGPLAARRRAADVAPGHFAFVIHDPCSQNRTSCPLSGRRPPSTGARAFFFGPAPRVRRKALGHFGATVVDDAEPSGMSKRLAAGEDERVHSRIGKMLEIARCPQEATPKERRESAPIMGLTATAGAMR